MKHALSAFAALLSACAAGPSAGPASNPLVGSWQLLQYVDTPVGGAPVHAFGDPPVGLFVFTPDGHVSIDIMRNPPAVNEASVDQDPDACIPAWYCSYFGTYSYDASGPAWITRVTGGNIPNYIGTDQRRAFALDGDTMTISESYEVDGVTFSARRVLRRVAR